jgi:hypothetical protein
VDQYNNTRLNCATGYIAPKDMLAGRQPEIHAERDRKLAAGRKQRQIRRQQASWRSVRARLGVVLLVAGSSNRRSPQVRSLNFLFADDPLGVYFGPAYD